jgi:HEAT repeat protein
MARGLSLQECICSEAAFRDADPMVRLAAVHHAGARLCRGEGRTARVVGGLQAVLLRQLNDPDARVARYAAVALAQAGERDGLDYLTGQLRQAGPADRAALLACLRNCTRFPFAVLLHALAGLHGQGGINPGNLAPLLREAVYLREEEYLERARRTAGYRKNLLEQLVNYQTRAGRQQGHGPACDVAVVQSVPRTEQRGVLVCRPRKLFLQFGEEGVLNPDRLQAGAEAVFVAVLEDPEAVASFVFLLADVSPAPGPAPADLLLTSERKAGLVPGMVLGVQALPGGALLRLAAVCHDGREIVENYPTHGTPVTKGQLLLATPDARGARPQVLLLEGTYPEPVRQRLLSESTQRVFERCVGALEDPDAAVQARATERLVRFGAAAVSALVPRLGQLPEAAVAAVARIGPPAVSAVVDGLRSQHPVQRDRCLAALRAMGPPALPALVDTLRRAGNSQVASLMTLSADLTPLLTPALQSADSVVRAGAAEVLGRLGINRVEDLIAGLRKKTGHPEAIAGLARLGSAAVPALMKSLKEKEPNLRFGAVEALVQIGEPAAGPLVNLFRTDPSMTLPEDALARMGARAVPALIEALADAKKGVRRRARRVLVRIGAPARAALEQAATDRRSFVAQNAARALEQLRGARP